jgi:AAA domain (Cdc48 subfamily)
VMLHPVHTSDSPPSYLHNFRIYITLLFLPTPLTDMLSRFRTCTKLFDLKQYDLLTALQIVSDYGDDSKRIRNAAQDHKLSMSVIRSASWIIASPDRSVAVLDDMKQHPHISKTRVTMLAQDALPIFAATSASRAIDTRLQRLLAVPRHHARPIIIGVFGKPAVGKNVLVRRFARQLYEHWKLHNEPNLPAKFTEFYHEHDCAQLVSPESAATFIGTAVGVKGGQGRLATQLQAKARVIVFDELDKAHPDVVKPLTKLFEEGRLSNISDEKADSYVECLPKTVFFLLANVDGDTDVAKNRLALFDTMLASDDFKETADQSDIESVDLKKKRSDLLKMYFSGTKTALRSRIQHTYLAYRPDPSDDPLFDPRVVCSLLQSQLSSLLHAFRCRCGWTNHVVDACVKNLQHQFDIDEGIRGCRVAIGNSLEDAWMSHIHNTENVNLLNTGTHAMILDMTIAQNPDANRNNRRDAVSKLSFVLRVVELSEDMKLHCRIIDRMVKGSQPNVDGSIVPPAPAPAPAVANDNDNDDVGAARPGGGGGGGGTIVDIDVDMDVDRNGAGLIGAQAEQNAVPNDPSPPLSADEKHDNKSDLYNGVPPISSTKPSSHTLSDSSNASFHVAIVFIAVLFLVYLVPH